MLRPALLVALAVATACERKAPGPDECRRFAYLVTGARRRELLVNPELGSRVDELTRQCLTTPFDRELLACVEQTGRFNACSARFARRRQRGPAEGAPELWYVR